MCVQERHRRTHKVCPLRAEFEWRGEYAVHMCADGSGSAGTRCARRRRRAPQGRNCAHGSGGAAQGAGHARGGGARTCRTPLLLRLRSRSMSRSVGICAGPGVQAGEHRAKSAMGTIFLHSSLRSRDGAGEHGAKSVINALVQAGLTGLCRLVPPPTPYPASLSLAKSTGLRCAAVLAPCPKQGLEIVPCRACGPSHPRPMRGASLSPYISCSHGKAPGRPVSPPARPPTHRGAAHGGIRLLGPSESVRVQWRRVGSLVLPPILAQSRLCRRRSGFLAGGLARGGRGHGSSWRGSSGRCPLVLLPLPQLLSQLGFGAALGQPSRHRLLLSRA